MASTRLWYYMLSYPGSQLDLARETGIIPVRISQYVNGRKRIPSHHLLAISRAMQLDPCLLVGFVGADEEMAMDVVP